MVYVKNIQQPLVFQRSGLRSPRIIAERLAERVAPIAVRAFCTCAYTLVQPLGQEWGTATVLLEWVP